MKAAARQLVNEAPSGRWSCALSAIVCRFAVRECQSWI